MWVTGYEFALSNGHRKTICANPCNLWRKKVSSEQEAETNGFPVTSLRTRIVFA